MQHFKSKKGADIKAWVEGVQLDPKALNQVYNTASLPIVFKHIALMPDVHYGLGATVGSVVPTKNAIIPAAVGVDIGCGMCAVQLSLTAKDLPDSLKEIREIIEETVPVGFDHFSQSGVGKSAKNAWDFNFAEGYKRLEETHPKAMPRNIHPVTQLGTLGGGNHFIELCLDTDDNIWLMLHSGSRGIGNRIGTQFVYEAKQEMFSKGISLVDKDLSYLSEGSQLFNDYVYFVNWAQEYARINRDIMLENILFALREVLPAFTLVNEAVNCHHNYVEVETHFGEEVFVTRKGAVRAGEGDLGIIPGSMGACSYIVRGKGNSDSFHSCSHGAGRVMSRSQAKKTFTVEQHEKATQGIECRKDIGVLDETPGAYKDIDAVMAAQTDLVEVVHQLRQVVCVKG